jgi:hypothetical protein
MTAARMDEGLMVGPRTLENVAGVVGKVRQESGRVARVVPAQCQHLFLEVGQDQRDQFAVMPMAMTSEAAGPTGGKSKPGVPLGGREQAAFT